ncbi:MAG: DUF2974 domain-containing protein [Ruminococcaceae bacterium]|nr:DUF2974 domain-containing protein [Oscillospiraceae bacterium]
MPTVFDYIDWRGDLTFDQSSMGEVDALILSMISYVDFEDILQEEDGSPSMTLLDVARKYARMHRGKPQKLGLIVPPEVVSIMVKAAKSKRFGGLFVHSYVNIVNAETETQFSAVTFSYGEKAHFIAFRGTDDTLVGWKEDFNMCFMHPVPAQLEALSYLEAIAQKNMGRLFLGGHSKGGNLAVFSAVRACPQTRERIITVFNNDGPGFTREFVESIEYTDMLPKIRTLVPQSSVVGMLLEHEGVYEVIKSAQSGILQHNAFFWEVLGNSFVHLNTVTGESMMIDRTLKKWLSEMSPEVRETFVDSLFETIAASGATTLTELNADKIKLVKTWNNLPPESRALVRKCISILIRDVRGKRAELR